MSSKELHFEVIDKVGNGTFATVKKARYKNMIVAAKIFDRISPSNEQEFSKELAQLKRLNHQNIIHIIDYGKYREQNSLYHTILLEFADLGSLDTLLHGKKDLNYTLGHAINWLYQTANGVNYLHTYNPKPIIHRDLKPLNLLLMKGGTLLKLCDFGTTTDMHTKMTMDKGTPLYIAPEVLSISQYNEKCDVYSYGIILWELFTRKRPYFDKNFKSYQIIISVKEFGTRPQKISNCPRLLALLYERIIDDANKRPTMAFILKIFEKLNSVINKNPIPPLVPSTPVTPRFDLFSSTESLLSKAEKSPFTTVVKNAKPLHFDASEPNFQTNNKDETDNRSPFVRDNKRFSFHENNFLNVNNNASSAFNDTAMNSSYTEANKPNPARSHRRTRSDLNQIQFDNINASQQVVVNNPGNVNCNSNEIVDIFDLKKPYGPITNHKESEGIYNEHLMLLKDNEILQKEIETLTKQKDDMSTLLKNQTDYHKLLDQKQRLENSVKSMQEKK